MMRKILLLGLFIGFISVKAQICDTIYHVCNSGTSGPFDVVNLNTPPSTNCSLTFQNGGVLMIFEIVAGGPLNVLFESDLQNSYIDVVLYNVPAGIAPCNAIVDPSNIIACGIAANASGCFQFGSFFPCNNSVPAPNVNTGDVIVAAIDNPFGDNTNISITIGTPPSAQIDIGVYPIITGQYLCHNAPPLQLNFNPSGGIWSGSSALTSGGIFDPSVSGIGQHPVEYSFTNSINCTTTSYGTVNVQDCTNLLSNFSTDEIKIYPNPARDFLLLDLSPEFYPELTITDINGKVIYRKYLSNITTQIDISHLSDGLYIVHLGGKNGVASQKLIVCR